MLLMLMLMLRAEISVATTTKCCVHSFTLSFALWSKRRRLYCQYFKFCSVLRQKCKPHQAGAYIPPTNKALFPQLPLFPSLPHCPLPPPTGPSLHSPPAAKRPLWNQLEGLGECCKLPQWGPGRSPGRSRILLHSVLVKLIWLQHFWFFGQHCSECQNES